MPIKSDQFYEFILEGTLQGVGFRPYVFNQANKQKIKGYIQNTNQGIKIITNKKKIMEKILSTLPKNAKINKKIITKIKKSKQTDHKQTEQIHIQKKLKNKTQYSFTIKQSNQNENLNQRQINIPTDLSTCNECLKELHDKTNHRHNYFAISCTSCGPRYSILNDLPFDRENTQLKEFKLCKACKEEYTNPNNRRFHAQTIACQKCGPQLTLYKQTPNQTSSNSTNQTTTNSTSSTTPNNFFKEISKNEDAIKETAELIKKGEIVAIKGIGGFHLACNMKKETTNKLKELLKRHHKPFALMAKNKEIIKLYSYINQKEEEILTSQIRPIILLKKIHKNSYNHVSELNSLGFMLPYTPQHFLLFNYLDEPIILTSSNLPSMPITTKKEEQFVKYILDFNREISNFVDDSIIKVISNNHTIIRKSRGLTIQKIKIPSNYLLNTNNNINQIYQPNNSNKNPDLIAYGTELKNTIAIKKEDYIYLSQHNGNTFTLESLDLFKKTLEKLKSFTQINPQIILSDKNKNFNITKLSQKYVDDTNNINDINKTDTNSTNNIIKTNNTNNTNKNNDEIKIKKLPHNLKLQLIQHHKAHAFSIAMEHNLKDFIAIVCDGTGLGEDGTVWGGEIFHNNIRIGTLEPQNLVGGDIANKEPKRMLIGILAKFMTKQEILQILQDINPNIDSKKIYLIYEQNKQNFNTIPTSSTGRILDCIAIILNYGKTNHYEGRCAMLLESNATEEKTKMYLEPQIKLNTKTQLIELQTTPLIKFIIENSKTIPKENLARFAHIYIAKGLLEIAKKYKEKNKIQTPICFTGGVAYNEIITSFMLKNKVKINKNIPCGDGGISHGQIAYWLWKQNNKK